MYYKTLNEFHFRKGSKVNLSKNLKRIYSILCAILLTSCAGNEMSGVNNNDVEVETVETVETNLDEKNNTIDKVADGHSIYITTDIHLLANSINDKGSAFTKFIENGDGTQKYYTNEILSALSENIAKDSPEYFIISGDLTLNGEKESHKAVAEQLREIEKNGTEVLIIPGNHDINNPWARGFSGDQSTVVESVTAEEFVDIYSDFGYNEAFSKDENSLSYLSTPTDDLWFLMLDTTMHDNNKEYPVTNGKLKPETLDWIIECSKLAEESGAEIVTVMHHNLYNHSSLLSRGFTLDNNTKVLSTFKEAGQQLVFSGHIHIQDIKADNDNQVYEVVNSSLIVYPVQYGKLTYSKDGGFDYKTARVPVEEWAKANDIKDTNLLNFDDYETEYFSNDSYEMAYNDIIKSGEYTEEQADMMSEYMSKVNLNYFAGTLTENKEEFLNDDAYLLWQSSNFKFIKQYLESMLNDSVNDNTTLHIYAR